MHNLPQFVGDFKAQLSATSFGSLKLSGVQTSLAGEQVAIRNELQAHIVNASRLHIPVSWHNEVRKDSKDSNDRTKQELNDAELTSSRTAAASASCNARTLTLCQEIYLN